MVNRMRLLEAQGQSVWQDNLTRDQLRSGQLQQLVEADGISGVTSNPSIFHKAITSSTEYDDQIRTLAEQGKSPAQIVDALIIDDVRDAADVLRPVYDRTDGQDGFVSIAEAHRLWNAVNRPNLMVKIPGTWEGVPAIRQCLIDGININITLLFAIDHYLAVANAYLDALAARRDQGKPIDRLASVASFFVSRVDTIVDRTIAEQEPTVSDPTLRAQLGSRRGQVAIANAKLAYAEFQRLFTEPQGPFATFARAGARVQRPLWASTSMKDPKGRDVLYVEELIAPDTINTLPPATIEAFRAHGEVRGNTALEGVNEARENLQTLHAAGIDLSALTDRLEEDGLRQFAEAMAELTSAVAQKAAAATKAA